MLNIHHSIAIDILDPMHAVASRCFQMLLREHRRVGAIKVHSLVHHLNFKDSVIAPVQCISAY
jgi:hypothetical protein